MAGKPLVQVQHRSHEQRPMSWEGGLVIRPPVAEKITMARSLPDLSQFYGTENYYQHFLRQFVYTDGVHFLAEQCGAYWLIDAIASYQPKLKKKPRLRDMQFWKIVAKDGKAVLTCREDSGYKPAVTQDIESTDFPDTGDKGLELWVENEVLYLPSER